MKLVKKNKFILFWETMIMALIVFVIYFLPCLTSIESKGSASNIILTENAINSDLGVIPDQIKLNINSCNDNLIYDNNCSHNYFALQDLRQVNNKLGYLIISNNKLRSTIKPTCYTGFNYFLKLHSYTDPENLS